MVARGPEGRCDHAVGREVVKPDRSIPPVGQHNRQVRSKGSMRAMVKLVSFVNMFDQRLAGLGMRDRS